MCTALAACPVALNFRLSYLISSRREGPEANRQRCGAHQRTIGMPDALGSTKAVSMVELVRYVSEEFRRGDSIPLTLLWLFALAASRGRLTRPL